MPLNLEIGEPISGVGGPYRVAPRGRWEDSKFYHEARKYAVAVFISSGAMLPIVIDPRDVLIQEYPVANRLAFIFQRTISGREVFYPHVFELPIDLVREFRAAGYWGDNI